MKRLVVALIVGMATATLAMSGCGQTPSAPAPTSPTSAPKAPEPTKAQAVPTKAVEPTKAAPTLTTVDYPGKGKTITVIMPWTAGGATDVGARVLAATLEKVLGTSIQVVNKVGAGGQVGTTELTNSKPDGYTIGVTNLPVTYALYLDPSRKAAFTRKNLSQVANQVWDPEAIVTTSKSPYKTLKDLIDGAKANPEKISVGIGAVGGDNHLALLMFEKLAGVQFSKVSFEGSAPATPALMGGHIDLVLFTLGNYAALLKSGELRVLGIMDEQRSPFAPDVPTFKEQGFNISLASSRGFSAPAGTPSQIIGILSSGIKKAMEEKELNDKMTGLFLQQRYMDTAQYTRYWDEFEAQVGPLLATTWQPKK